MVEPSDVGHRISLRRRLSGPDGVRLSDLTGELIELTEAYLVVRTEAGDRLWLARGEIDAIRRVPPRPPRYSQMLELERIAARCWPAPIQEALGDWLLRAAEGWTIRANSALVLGDPGMPIPAAIEACQSWYTAHNLPPKITVPVPVRRDVAEELTRLSWQVDGPVEVRTAELARLAPLDAPPTQVATHGLTAPADAPAMAVELTSELSPDLIGAFTENRGQLPAVARRMLTGPAKVTFAVIRDDAGAIIATARGSIDHPDWLHIGLVWVAPSHRRHGLAAAVTVALAGWAQHEQARRAVLQVSEDNLAAKALYGQLGFTVHHRYRTFVSPGSPSGEC